MATRQVNAGHDVTSWNRAMQPTTPVAGAAKLLNPIARGDAVLEVLDLDGGTTVLPVSGSVQVTMYRSGRSGSAVSRTC